MLEATLAATAPSAWTIVEDATETKGVVEAWFTFETGVARGFRDRRSWLERKRAHEAALGRTEQPYCVVIGVADYISTSESGWGSPSGSIRHSNLF